MLHWMQVKSLHFVSYKENFSCLSNRLGNICPPRCARSWRSYELCRCVHLLVCVCVLVHLFRCVWASTRVCCLQLNMSLVTYCETGLRGKQINRKTASSYEPMCWWRTAGSISASYSREERKEATLLFCWGGYSCYMQHNFTTRCGNFALHAHQNKPAPFTSSATSGLVNKDITDRMKK